MRDSYVCQIRGPRCLGRATTVHHVLPSSQYPELFFASHNLQSACARCNSGEGAQIASDNRANRATVAHLERVVEQQADEIDELHRRLDQYEHPQPRPTPAIR